MILFRQMVGTLLLSRATADVDPALGVRGAKSESRRDPGRLSIE
jgi:hypothetical protein